MGVSRAAKRGGATAGPTYVVSATGARGKSHVVVDGDYGLGPTTMVMGPLAGTWVPGPQPQVVHMQEDFIANRRGRRVFSLGFRVYEWDELPTASQNQWWLQFFNGNIQAGIRSGLRFTTRSMAINTREKYGAIVDDTEPIGGGRASIDAQWQHLYESRGDGGSVQPRMAVLDQALIARPYWNPGGGTLPGSHPEDLRWGQPSQVAEGFDFGGIAGEIAREVISAFIWRKLGL